MLEIIEYRAYRLQVGRVGKGWRASIYSPGSTSALPDSPTNLENSRKDDIVPEAAEDEERCLQSSIIRQPVMLQGLTTEGKLRPFSGIVQAVEKGHTQYPDYPLRITMK
jgi:hypothetical protein